MGNKDLKEIPKIMNKWDWNITGCRAIYKGHKEANYNFWIVDYYNEKILLQRLQLKNIFCSADIDDDFSFLDYHIIDMRNLGVVGTKYFKTEKEAVRFIRELNKEK